MNCSTFIFILTNFCVIISFFNQLLTLGILFSTLVRAVVVAKLVILGIWFLVSFILVSRVGLVAKLVISGILFSTFFMLALYTSFLTTSFFFYIFIQINRNRYKFIQFIYFTFQIA